MTNSFLKKAPRTILLAAFASTALLIGCDKDALEATDPMADGAISALEEPMAIQNGPNGQRFVANEVLVKFRAGTSSDARANALARISASVKEKIHTKAMEQFGDMEGLTLVKTPMAVLDAVGRLKGMGEIEYAEPNFVYTHQATSNDPAYTGGSLWGMYGSSTTPANQFGSQAGVAWGRGFTGSNTVYIGIIDEGYMYTHEDLAANAGVNPGEIPGNGIDDDGNGYVDDVYGWDFDGSDNSVFDGTTDDHGTHVAGTIGGVGGNGKGVAGVVWNVKLLNAKFLGRRGGTTANAIKSVDYFTDLKTRHKLNLVATNNSWGGGGFSQGLMDAIERANAADILFIAAAGNDGNDTETSTSYPSGYPNANIIAVASITNTGALSSFSNYAATKVDIGAPGSSIYSTVPKSSRGQIVSGYSTYSGTSMAAPHVCGAVALYAATKGVTSAAVIKNAIMSSAIPTASLNGKCLSNGRLDANGALAK
jgi:subtilisin family serine protease